MEHLTPMSLDIKMLSHRNNYMAKKSKQDMLRMNTSENEDGHVSENTDVMELV